MRECGGSETASHACDLFEKRDGGEMKEKQRKGVSSTLACQLATVCKSGTDVGRAAPELRVFFVIGT